MAASSVGVARLDLVRPGLLDVDAYDSRNILYTRPGVYRRGPGRPPRIAREGGGLTGGFLTVGGGGGQGGGRRRAREVVPAYVLDTAAGGEGAGGGGGYDDDGAFGGGALGTGARFKIMRCWQLRPRGNDLEGARRVEEAAAAAAEAEAGLKLRKDKWAWPWRGKTGGSGSSSPPPPLELELPAEEKDQGQQQQQQQQQQHQRHHRGLELVGNSPAAGAAELFGSSGDGGARLMASSLSSGDNDDDDSNSHGLRRRSSHYYSLRAPRPLLDFGLGAALNLDRSRLEPIVRLKVAGLVSFHATPRPRLKIARVWRLPGTAMALRLRYECPLTCNAWASPWQPPARLALRLDNGVGSGVHLSPGGVEFDERRVALGDNLAIRAGATLLFPRSLPMPRGEDALRVRVNRLSVKTLW
jgi:hypothetical protein